MKILLTRLCVDELYVKLKPINPGKIAFEKTMRTGVNPFTKYLKTA